MSLLYTIIIHSEMTEGPVTNLPIVDNNHNNELGMSAK